MNRRGRERRRGWLLPWLALVLSCGAGRCHCGAEPARPEPALTTSVVVPVVDASDANDAADVVDASGDGAVAEAEDELADGGCVDVVLDAKYRARKECDDEPDKCAGDPYPTSDLDGDGIPEVLFAIGGHSYNEWVYLYRGGSCTAFIGKLATSPTAQKTRHEGWADLATDDTSSCEGVGLSWGCEDDRSVYVFHDGRYREDPARRSHTRIGGSDAGH